MRKALSALQAATEYGGYDMAIGKEDGDTAADVRRYFSRKHFEKIFGVGEGDECGGYTLDECADAVIEAMEGC
jgi:hypothetical protein